MQRSVSAPNGLGTLSGHRDSFNDDKAKHVTTGGSMASRMRLDATLAPSTLDLRMNRRNLLNEMKLNGGKIISNQFALMRPRRRTQLEKPRGLDIPASVKNRDLFEKVAASRRASALLGGTGHSDFSQDMFGGQTGGLDQTVTTLVESGLPSGMVLQSSLVEARRGRRVSLRDPTQTPEVQDLMKDQHVAQVFASFAKIQEGSLSRELVMPPSNLTRALDTLGYIEPDRTLIKTLLSSLVRVDGASKDGTSPLEHAEFCVVVQAFAERRKQYLKDHFHALDRDNSRSIDKREFRHLLWENGYTVGPSQLDEIFREVDEDLSGEIEMKEFERAVNTVYTQHGFTSHEAEELFKVFDRYDADKSGSISADELPSALGWAGWPVTFEESRELVNTFAGPHGELLRPQFLRLMRHRLEEELSEMHSLFARCDTARQGTLSSTQVVDLLLNLGYTLQPDVVNEAVRGMDPKVHASALYFEDVVELIRYIRQCEGFTRREVNELLNLFGRFQGVAEVPALADSVKGELREFEVARTFAWLGYAVGYRERRTLFFDADTDKNGRISEEEYLKLVRFLREMEIAAAKEFLRVNGPQPEAKDVKTWLERQGYRPSEVSMSQIAGMLAQEDCTLSDMLRILSTAREERAALVRQSGGLTEEHAERLYSRFRSKTDAGHQILPRELERFMHELFRTPADALKDRDFIASVIKDHCKGQGLDMADACRSVLAYDNHRKEDQWRREQDAIEAANFTAERVDELRHAHFEADDESLGTITKARTYVALQELLRLSLAQRETLRKQLDKLGDVGDNIDFAKFITLAAAIRADGFAPGVGARSGRGQ